MKAIIMIIVALVLLIICLIVVVDMIELRRYSRIKSGGLKLLRVKDDNYHKVKRANCKHGERVVITMTTIPDRLQHLGPTLTSLLDQIVRVDEICLNLPYTSRKGLRYKIPKWLSSLKSVKIHRCDVDQGPGTKLLPTLKREQDRRNMNTRIIVVDDDNIYNSNTIKILLQKFENLAAKKGEGKIAVTNFGLSLTSDKLTSGKKRPSIPKCIRTYISPGGKVDLLQGFSGFVVTPAMFPPEVHYLGTEEMHKLKDCPKEAISVDDIWFSGWLMRNNVEIRSLGHVHRQMPLINYGSMRKTTRLASGENRGFISDNILIRWFWK